jgi:hypothetical protein
MLLSAWLVVHSLASADASGFAFPQVQAPAARPAAGPGKPAGQAPTTATGGGTKPNGGAPAAGGGAASKPAANPAPIGESLGPRFDDKGWPITSGLPTAPNPAPPPTSPIAVGADVQAPGAAGHAEGQAGGSDARKGQAGAVGTPFDAFDGSRTNRPQGPAADVPALASGTQLGSPLLDVYKSVGGVEAFRGLEGCVVWWRVSTLGEQGEPIGLREVTHTADCRYAERDRLEFQDGRIYGRLGAQVFAELRGMPWPTLNDPASQDLMLFGLHLRAPWCFGDANLFMVVGKDFVDRSGERLLRITLERRPPASLEVVGPELDAKPRDRFELLCEPSSGRPRELVHRFACSLATRRVLLEDWRAVENVQMPFRRVYVDEAMRTKTTLEILRFERQRASERDFRLL